MKKLFPKLFKAKGHKKLPVGIIIPVIAAFLLGYALFSFIPFTEAEQPQALGSASLSEIKKHVIFAPVKALQFGILKFTDDDTYIRAASAVTALVASILMYLMLKKWHTQRLAFLTTLMFISSSLFLHVGRLANTEVMYLVVWPALLLSCMWFLSKNNESRLPLVAITLGLLLYIPGTWIFMLVGLIFFRKFTWKTLKKISFKLKLLCFSLFALTLVPLTYSFLTAQRQIVEWLGFNLDQSFTVKSVATNFIDIPKQLFFTGFDDPIKWLGGTPILDIFAVTMLVLGIYAYWAGYYPAREKLVYGSIILSILMIGVGNVATISLLVPLLYIVMANGIAYMLQSWFAVFPRNPFAKSLGIVILAAVIGLSCFYQLQRYFVAWPDSEATKAALLSKQ